MNFKFKIGDKVQINYITSSMHGACGVVESRGESIMKRAMYGVRGIDDNGIRMVPEKYLLEAPAPELLKESTSAPLAVMKRVDDGIIFVVSMEDYYEIKHDNRYETVCSYVQKYFWTDPD